MIGLDTTALIDLWKEKKEVLNLLSELNDRFAVSIINYKEIMLGINRNDSKRKKELVFFEKFFKNVYVFSLDLESGKKSIEIYWDLAKKGKIIDYNDCTTAGIYLTNGVDSIITKNVKHFSRIKGLKVIGY